MATNDHLTREEIKEAADDPFGFTARHPQKGQHLTSCDQCRVIAAYVHDHLASNPADRGTDRIAEMIDTLQRVMEADEED